MEEVNIDQTPHGARIRIAFNENSKEAHTSVNRDIETVKEEALKNIASYLLLTNKEDNNNNSNFLVVEELDLVNSNVGSHQKIKGEVAALDDQGVVKALAKAFEGLAKNNHEACREFIKIHKKSAVGNNTSIDYQRNVLAAIQIYDGIGIEPFKNLLEFWENVFEVKDSSNHELVRQADLVKNEDSEPGGTNWKLVAAVVIGLALALGLGYLAYRVSSAYFARNGGPPVGGGSGYPVGGGSGHPVSGGSGHPVSGGSGHPVDGGSGFHLGGNTWHWGNGPKNG